MPEEKILLAHGSGGKLSHDLIKQILLPQLTNPFLEPLDDSAKITNQKGPIAFTTDSYVVNPIFFPGGDIGKLAVCGTVNDLSMIGAAPSYLSLSLIIEEGFSIDLLKKIVTSIHEAAEQAKVKKPQVMRTKVDSRDEALAMKARYEPVAKSLGIEYECVYTLAESKKPARHEVLPNS